MLTSLRNLQTILSAFALFCLANTANPVSAAQLNISGTWDLTVNAQSGPGPFKFSGTETGNWSFSFEYSGSGNSFVVDSYSFDIAGYQFSTFRTPGDNSITVTNPGANTSVAFNVDFGTGSSVSGPGTLGLNLADFDFTALADGSGRSLVSAVEDAFQLDGALKTTDFDVATNQLEVYTFNLTGTSAFVPEPSTWSMLTAVACCAAWRNWRRRSSRN